MLLDKIHGLSLNLKSQRRLSLRNRESFDPSIEFTSGDQDGDQSGHCSRCQGYSPRLLPPLLCVVLRLKDQASWNGGHRHHQSQGRTSHNGVSQHYFLIFFQYVYVELSKNMDPTAIITLKFRFYYKERAGVFLGMFHKLG